MYPPTTRVSQYMVLEATDSWKQGILSVGNRNENSR